MGVDAELRFKLKKGAELPSLEEYKVDSNLIKAVDYEDCTHVIHLPAMYYGFGYARGDFPYILSVVLALKSNPSITNVMYGGGQSEYFHEPMTMKLINKLMSHWCKYGNRPWLEA